MIFVFISIIIDNKWGKSNVNSVHMMALRTIIQNMSFQWTSLIWVAMG